MSAYADTCPECGREFENYREAFANRPRCSVGCDIRAGVAVRESEARKEDASTSEPLANCCACARSWDDWIESGRAVCSSCRTAYAAGRRSARDELIDALYAHRARLLATQRMRGLDAVEAAELNEIEARIDRLESAP